MSNSYCAQPHQTLLLNSVGSIPPDSNEAKKAEGDELEKLQEKFYQELRTVKNRAERENIKIRKLLEESNDAPTPDPPDPPYAEEGCKLFVYGIDEGVSNSELQKEFEKFRNVIDTRNTGKGFAFVTLANKDDALKAIEQLDGDTILGQQIKVNVSRPRNNEGGRGGGGESHDGNHEHGGRGH